MNRIFGIVTAVGVCVGTIALAQSPVGLKRTDLQRHDLSIEGHEAIQTRVDFAPHAVAPWHSHPGEELIYVPEGMLEFQIRGQEPVTLKTGDAYFIPAGAVHTARNLGTVPAVELATYIVENGKPLLVRAEKANGS
jgi:quercetin dioxygenase-like cupin family protein